MNETTQIDAGARVAELLAQLTGLIGVASLVGGAALEGDGAPPRPPRPGDRREDGDLSRRGQVRDRRRP